ncbi:protein-L-isoaspartate O-methyltransferase domain-containing protein 1-like [Neodiprion virginianus]|uniref:protein-L-isoaspartate O-methyltransferase domain-containing protein 1-like n=1 Tax=Neodiprion virginianus TaxID=2961670 RepID=UPI001EE77772|nr:protein-L-isoaspartate O-methyltransferase domain-containing protein 1-like [Neodiprion virginianus]XP_046618092.1 protein-L-isoaspartate O-methyltransferase domain-containing protein 1-like [Neodiprion virginianus]
MMGGALTIGQSNDDLVEYLLETGYIRRKEIEVVFRAVDRASYLLPSHQESAYKDLAWKHGNLHLSAPCVYGVAMEYLSLQPGQSFLNIGSGTGYLSTMAGLLLGPYGINHGIELHEDCLQYAYEQLEKFKLYSRTLEEFDFCEPSFVQGNCLRVTPGKEYDAVYCGAAVSDSNIDAIKRFVRVGGLVVMPYKGHLCCFTRTSENVWACKKSLGVSFATLIVPDPADQNSITLPDSEPMSLQELCRSIVRHRLRENIWEEFPELDRRNMNTSLHPSRNDSYCPMSNEIMWDDDDYEDDEEEEDEDDNEDDENIDDDDEGEGPVWDVDFIGRPRFIFNMEVESEPTSNPLQLDRVAMLLQQRTAAVGRRVGATLDRIVEEKWNGDAPADIGSPSTNLEQDESSGMAENQGTDAVTVDSSRSEAFCSQGKQSDERTARRSESDTESDNLEQDESSGMAENQGTDAVTVDSSRSEAFCSWGKQSDERTARLSESDTESDSEDEVPIQWKQIAKRDNSDSGIIADINNCFDDSSSSWSAVHSYSEVDDYSMDVDLSTVAPSKTYEKAYSEHKSDKPISVRSRLFINCFKEKIQMLPLPETMKMYINYHRKL